MWSELAPAACFALWMARFLEQHRAADAEDYALVSAGLVVSCALRPLTLTLTLTLTLALTLPRCAASVSACCSVGAKVTTRRPSQASPSTTPI